MNIDDINDLLAAVANKEREQRIAEEYYDMISAIDDQYFAMMLADQADLDAMQFGMAA